MSKHGKQALGFVWRKGDITDNALMLIGMACVAAFLIAIGLKP